jgi:hypothetical protein
MDIERQNFMKEVEAEIEREKQNETYVKSLEVNNKMIDALFCEACKRFGTTLKKLADN